jgi:hypothetical protein
VVVCEFLRKMKPPKAGLDMDTEMLYNARLYQQEDAWFTERNKSECHFCLLIFTI